MLIQSEKQPDSSALKQGDKLATMSRSQRRGRICDSSEIHPLALTGSANSFHTLIENVELPQSALKFQGYPGEGNYLESSRFTSRRTSVKFLAHSSPST